MKDIGLLIFGVLIVAAVLSLTAAIASTAPYVAAAIVIICLCWFFLSFDGKTPSTPEE